MSLPRLFLLLILQILSVSILAQPSHFKVDYGVSLLSRHSWRGTVLGNAPTIEPEVSVTKNKFSLGLWSAAAFNSSYEEIDIIASYSLLPSLNLTIWDYYNPVDGKSNNYLNYKQEDLRHTIEFTAEYDNDNSHFGFLGGVFLYGDADSATMKERFSTYLEPRFNFALAGVDFGIFAGITPFAGYYADKTAFINTGIKVEDCISINQRFEMPVQFLFFVNPYTKEASFSVSAGIYTKQDRVLK